jgi:hypothetical protein
MKRWWFFDGIVSPGPARDHAYVASRGSFPNDVTDM